MKPFTTLYRTLILTIGSFVILGCGDDQLITPTQPPAGEEHNHHDGNGEDHHEHDGDSGELDDADSHSGTPDSKAYGVTPLGDVVDAGPAPIEPSGSQVTSETPMEIGDLVQVKWEGSLTLENGRIAQESWWRGTVIGLQDDGNVKIHYTGWDSNWDEVVPRERLRLGARKSP